MFSLFTKILDKIVKKKSREKAKEEKSIVDEKSWIRAPEMLVGRSAGT